MDIGGRAILFRVTSPFRNEQGIRQHLGKFTFIVTHVSSGYVFTTFDFLQIAATRFNAGRNNYGRAVADAVLEKIEAAGLDKVVKALSPYD